MAERESPFLSVERRAAADDEELFRLYQDVFGEELTRGRRERWRWQYLENPQNGPDGPEIWVAREGGRLVGQYASMPVGLWWGGREVRSSWGLDLCVRPESRGHGIGERLLAAWSDHVEVAYVVGLTPSSYGLFRKLRCPEVGPVPFLRRIVDPVAVAKRRLGGFFGRAAGEVLRMALRALCTDGLAPADVEVRQIAGFSAEYDKLWERARASYVMCVRRDAAYLEWKYVRCPHRRYELREARRRGELVGFAVSRREENRGVGLGWIVDVFADASDHGAKDALIASVLDGFRAAGVARAQAFTLNADLAADLRRRGFFSGPSRTQLFVRSRVAPDGVFENLGRWHVVFGDSDTDR